MLANCCSSIWFVLIQYKSCLHIFRSCGRKIRNATELYYDIKTAVTSSNAITASAMNCEAAEDSQYFEFASVNITGKLEQSAVG